VTTTPVERQDCSEEMDMKTRAGMMVMAAAVAATALGCAQQVSGPAVVVEDKVYAVTPDTLAVKAGIMTGNVTEMKVTERVEKGSGKVVSPAKLSGKLLLRNSSADQTVRLIEGKIRFIDDQGNPIMVDSKPVESAFKFSSYGMTERLDPGQEATQAVDVDFPAAALEAKKLKGIRLDVVYLPASYRAETVNLPVSIATP
jgi:hypothetical protein